MGNSDNFRFIMSNLMTDITTSIGNGVDKVANISEIVRIMWRLFCTLLVGSTALFFSANSIGSLPVEEAV